MIYTATSPWFYIPATVDRSAVAIADVHGRADLLEAILSYIEQKTPSTADIIFLGDLIDRGSQSLRSMDLAKQSIPGRNTSYIAGNHEQMLICATHIQNPASLGALVLWRENGGHTVIEELGIEDEVSPQKLSDALGEENLRFLHGMDNYVRNGQVLFVHGGVHPGRPLQPQLDRHIDFFFDMQNEDDDIRWVRHPWVGYDNALEDDVFVIYGHTIQRPAVPMVTICQAGIDLGAYTRGILCAAEVSETGHIRYHFVGEYDRIEDAKRLLPGVTARYLA